MRWLLVRWPLVRWPLVWRGGFAGPEDLAGFIAVREAGDLAGGVALEDLATARFRGKEEHIAGLGLPLEGWLAGAPGEDAGAFTTDGEGA